MASGSGVAASGLGWDDPPKIATYSDTMTSCEGATHQAQALRVSALQEKEEWLSNSIVRSRPWLMGSSLILCCVTFLLQTFDSKAIPLGKPDDTLHQSQHHQSDVGGDSDQDQSSEASHDLDNQLEHAAEELHSELDAVGGFPEDVQSIASVTAAAAAASAELEVAEAEMLALEAEHEAQVAKAETAAMEAENKAKLAQMRLELAKLRLKAIADPSTTQQPYGARSMQPHIPPVEFVAPPAIFNLPPLATHSPSPPTLQDSPLPAHPQNPPRLDSPSQQVGVVPQAEDLAVEASAPEDSRRPPNNENVLAWNSKYCPPRRT